MPGRAGVPMVITHTADGTAVARSQNRCCKSYASGDSLLAGLMSLPMVVWSAHLRMGILGRRLGAGEWGTVAAPSPESLLLFESP